MISRRNFIRNTALTAASLPLLKSNILASNASKTGLRNLFRKDFYVGTTVHTAILMGNRQDLKELVKREFSSITAENEFKWAHIHPNEGEWRFEFPDEFVKFGMENKMYMLGHCLVWHAQVPDNLFIDGSGKQLGRDVLHKKMEVHISTLVDRYKGKIQAWDVVNEAITPEEGWRKTKWIEIIGPEFMESAFHFAHEADPKAHLLYNDYNMHQPLKRQLVVEILKDFKKRGVPVHGVGMQGHYHIDSVPLAEIEKSIKAYIAEGVKVHFTELDIDVLPVTTAMTADISANAAYHESLNPYKNGLPKEIDDKLSRRYEDLFKLFLKYKDDIERVTFWGISDDLSWKNNWPVKGRTNYPLLFDREQKPKNCYHAIAALKGQTT